MDLTSGYPFWPVKNGLLASYPSLKQDLHCDIAIVGGGISGALVAFLLVEAGCNVIVVDKRDIATGSTSASTALLQYEVDTPLIDLITLVGRDHAVRSYLLCLQAIDHLEQLVARLDETCDFERKHSLYLASRHRDTSKLRAEYEVRRTYGFRLEYWDKHEIEARFPFTASSALYSYDAAQVDTYRLTHAILRVATAQGLRVFDRTPIASFEQKGDQGVILTSQSGCRITARKVVMAAGFESQHYLPQPVAHFKSTYALVSEPVESLPGWYEQCLIWESARPYLYMRTTRDGRVILGGEDDAFDQVTYREHILRRKRDRLLKRFHAMFPQIHLEPAYIWGGTFGETKDGLAYIGEAPGVPNTYFALGYGGNGITYSLIAAEIIRDLFLGKPNANAELFRFER